MCARCAIEQQNPRTDALKFFSNPSSLIYAIELLKCKSKTYITHKDSYCNLRPATCKAQTQDHSARIPHFIVQYSILCIVSESSFSTGPTIEILHETRASKQCYSLTL